MHMNIIGKKLKRIRTFRKKTQQELADSLQLPVNRIGRYEIGDRIPKPDMLEKIAHALNVNTSALSNIDVESNEGLMHLLFYLEDTHGLEICKIEDEYYLHFNKFTSFSITSYLKDWYDEYQKELGDGTNYSEEQKYKYDEWRYTFPEPLVKRTREMIDEYDRTHSKKE